MPETLRPPSGEEPKSESSLSPEGSKVEEEKQPLSPKDYFEYRLDYATDLFNAAIKEKREEEGKLKGERDKKKLKSLIDEINNEAEPAIRKYEKILDSLSNGKTGPAEREAKKRLKLVEGDLKSIEKENPGKSPEQLKIENMEYKNISDDRSSLLEVLEGLKGDKNIDVLEPAQRQTSEPAAETAKGIPAGDTAIGEQKEAPAQEPEQKPQEGPDDAHQQAREKAENELKEKIEEKSGMEDQAYKNKYIQDRLDKKKGEIMGDPLAEFWQKIGLEKEGNKIKKWYGVKDEHGAEGFKKVIRESLRESADELYKEYGDVVALALLDAGYHPYGIYETVDFSFEKIFNLPRIVVIYKLDGKEETKPAGQFETWLEIEIIKKYQDKIKKQAQEKLSEEYDKEYQRVVESRAAKLEKEPKAKPTEKEQPLLPERKEELSAEEKDGKIKEMAILWERTYKIDKALRRKRKSIDNFQYRVREGEQIFKGESAKKKARADKNRMSKELVELAQEVSGRDFKKDAAKIKKEWKKKDLEDYMTKQVMAVLENRGIRFIRESPSATGKAESQQPLKNDAGGPGPESPGQESPPAPESEKILPAEESEPASQSENPKPEDAEKLKKEFLKRTEKLPADLLTEEVKRQIDELWDEGKFDEVSEILDGLEEQWLRGEISSTASIEELYKVLKNRQVVDTWGRRFTSENLKSEWESAWVSANPMIDNVREGLEAGKEVLDEFTRMDYFSLVPKIGGLREKTRKFFLKELNEKLEELEKSMKAKQ